MSRCSGGPHRRLGRLAAALVLALGSSAVAATGAGAHARVSPAVSLAGQLQLYSLAVPTEKEGASTAKIVLTVPGNFAIDSFAPNPGWRRRLTQRGSGDNAVVQKVTWTGGAVPSGEDSVFQFLAEAARPGEVSFGVQQIYSDGSIVNWTGSGSSQSPAPTIDAVSSFSRSGAGGASVLEIVAIVMSALALLGSGLALAGRGDGGRPLA